MAIPATPVNFYAQQANGQVYLSWSLSAGATTYSVQRSTDGVSYSVLATPSDNSYLDTSVVVGTQYYYKVASVNGSGTSPYTSPQSAVPTLSADISLGQLRLMAQQRADRVNSNFVTLPEWNSYISQSAFELYDMLVSAYGDEYYATHYAFQTTGVPRYTLPTDFYKLMGVDLGITPSQDAWVTLKQFNFIDRNKYTYPTQTSNYMGMFNLRYRITANELFFIPTPQSAQYVRVWYVPKMVQPLKDTDILTGVSGWLEFIIIDAAIKALQKEESDVQIIAMQKMAIIQRIETMSQNRDIGSPQTISNTRRVGNNFGFGSDYGGGDWGNY